MKHPILEFPGMVKDSATGAILNTNNIELLNYKKKKKTMQKLLSNDAEITSLREEVNELKTLLNKILGKLNA